MTKETGFAMRDGSPSTHPPPPAASTSIRAGHEAMAESPLPLSRSPLIGRKQDIETIGALLLRDDVPLVVLVGPGGVGKTRLALEVARAAEDSFADGACFVALEAIRDPGLVVPTVAQALGLRDTGNRPLIEQLAAHLRPRQTLLVLDNFEQVVEAAPALDHLLTRCPGLKVLATSRVVLRLSVEHDALVIPLPVPAAVQLFVARAQATSPDFALTAANQEAVAAICARVDGLPLAIELAAARVPVLPPAALLARLERALPLLTGGVRDRPDRMRTMRDAIAWSHDLLATEEQVLFRRLAVFVGGFGLEAAEQLSRKAEGRYGGGRDAEIVPNFAAQGTSILDGISSLVEKSLLGQDGEASADPRFRMLETVREFGLERLMASGEIEDIQRMHAEYYARLVARAEPELTGANQLAWFERLETEHPNLRAALTWAMAHDPGTGLRMAGALIRFWDHHSHVREGQQWLEEALACSGGSPPSLRAQALWGAGVLAIGTGDYVGAERYLAESLDFARVAGDHYWMGFALGALGTVALHHGDLARASALAEEGLGHVRAVGDDDAIAALLGNLGNVAFFRGDHARAVARSEESLALYRALGSVHGAASVLSTLGRALLELGDHERALAVLDEGLILSQQVGNKWYTITALLGLAAAATARREWESAARLFGAVEALAEASGIAMRPADRAANERNLAAVRAHLAEPEFVLAWNASRAMSTEQIITEALAHASQTRQPEEATASLTPLATAGLTGREAEVLRLLAQGMSDREIAEELSLSPRTVGGHVTHLLGKLGVDSRTAAVALALRHHLLDPFLSPPAERPA
jgi:predicted ATPase/DNA-binding CsgD family transcriptional regulator